MKRIEEYVAVTNKTKGKEEKILGGILAGVGIVIPTATFIYDTVQFLDHGSIFSNLDKLGHYFNNLTPAAMMGGLFFGAGCVCGLVGRIKYWYWNKE
jgi:hypothetical protein